MEKVTLIRKSTLLSKKKQETAGHIVLRHTARSIIAFGQHMHISTLAAGVDGSAQLYGTQEVNFASSLQVSENENIILLASLS